MARQSSRKGARARTLIWLGAVLLAGRQALGQQSAPDAPDPYGPFAWGTGWMWFLVAVVLVIALVAWAGSRARRRGRLPAAGPGEDPWDRPTNPRL